MCLKIIQHVCFCSDGEDINPKVLQSLGSEKMKVSEALSKRSFSMSWTLSSVLTTIPSGSQYAVPVTKYDRKGYKARSRQLLLTANGAIIVEEGKVKQRIDYGALKGQLERSNTEVFLELP